MVLRCTQLRCNRGADWYSLLNRFSRPKAQRELGGVYFVSALRREICFEAKTRSSYVDRGRKLLFPGTPAHPAAHQDSQPCCPATSRHEAASCRCMLYGNAHGRRSFPASTPLRGGSRMRVDN